MKVTSCNCLERYCDSINLAVPSVNLIPRVVEDLNRYNNYVYHLMAINNEGTKKEKIEMLQYGATYCQYCGKKIEVENE